MEPRTSDLASPISVKSPARVLPSRQIEARKRADQVREKIVALIREGYLREGEKLPTEPQLSEMFGVGRSSVREAVQTLIGLGVVEMRPGRGAFVRRLSLNDLVRMVDGAINLDYGAALQLHEVRAMIEITAGRLAATRRTADDLLTIEDAILRYRFAEHKNDREALIDADLAFHAAIVDATHNEVLAKLLHSISGILREHRRQYGAATELSGRTRVIADHQRILGAIRDGDPAEAARRMQSHMRRIWSQIEGSTTKEGDSSFANQSYLPMYDDEVVSERQDGVKYAK